MYRPEYSKRGDQALALELIRKYPLGLLISHSDGNIATSPLPFLVEESAEGLSLIAHFAKANPHWAMLKEVLVHFQGPSRYISPNIYSDPINVPTWNYAVVQVHGTAELIQGRAELHRILNQMTSAFENENGTSWSYNLPPAMQENLEAAIVAVKIRIQKIEAKFKLSQNRNENDYAAVAKFLRTSPHPADLELLHWMLKTNE